VIKIGLPKGRTVSDSERFCAALGVKTRPGVLSYQTTLGGLGIAVFLLKMPDVARLLRSNVLDLGLAGDEWLIETGVSSDRRCFEARSYEASVCLLMAEDDHRPLRRIRSVVTPYPRLARSLLGGTAPDTQIVPVTGSSEALVPDIADACIEVVETGASAALNGLVIRESFVRVTTHLARSETIDPLAVAQVVALLADALEVAR
jgi:ATP phosphoribosyltransferase